MIKKLAFVAIGVALTLSLSHARDRDDRRQTRQKARIHQGVKSGELTKQEAKRLRAQQHGIQRAEKRAAQDGVMTPEEKAKLEKRQDRASKVIYKQKHDDQKRTEEPAGQ